MNRMNLVLLIDQLEDLVEKAPEIPITGRILLDADELFGLIDRIRESIPEEVKRAEAVSIEKERVISEGQQKAERMVAQAEEYAAKLVRNSEIHRQAEEEGKRILEEAAHRARQIEQGAEKYASSVLNDLQQALEKTLAVVNKGLEELDKED
ncbi:MAG: ATPase [Firmicutes bacterium]|jgi:F0F1-type ATP synthase membrane subunit b/b'|nr:ATPase [Bacillota bacterium]